MVFNSTNLLQELIHPAVDRRWQPWQRRHTTTLAKPQKTGARRLITEEKKNGNIMLWEEDGYITPRGKAMTMAKPQKTEVLPHPQS